MNQPQDSSDRLASQIDSLDSATVAEAVKNLSIAMQYTWRHPLSDDQARQVLQAAQVAGEAAVLRQVMLSDQQASPSEMERWGRALLRFVGTDPELGFLVEQAIDDALHSRAKDFGLSALIVLGTVIVLLKYRPTTVQVKKDGVKITWKENDVSIVKDLAKGVASVASVDTDAR